MEHMSRSHLLSLPYLSLLPPLPLLLPPPPRPPPPLPGRYVHIPPKEPVSTWATDFGTPWWADESYLIGNLSKKKRRIHIVNQLTGQDDVLDVCCEETLEEIQERYTKYNAHAKSYTWKRLGRPLNMKKNLDDNGIPDESQELEALAVDPDEFVPAIHVYFNDDLTVA